ncbi:UDP-N-acetylmuramoyl-tripeptide--D-alanyl-D-alanine ligase [Parasediminibacterium sp. JCM 36343]|uniref:UDP-N-acetylmuramoyl-tripeptide--D-alanyl-D- alanine ligase n=1 Tax=Parasediminibacterium sp. JCM 36343 TaxID=3374279 RepID=UPI00397AA7B1
MYTIEELYHLYLQHPSVQTDTRKLQKGDIFFALKGPNFNGNVYAATAIELGAAFVVVDEETGISNEKIVKVEDALKALQALAKHHRQQLNIPVLAITGSNGKTTTKELINSVLSTQYITYTTQGNLNNHIGVPLTLLSIKKDAQMAVVEMGANHLKEIESYCQYTLPTHGLITNCGKAHLEGFGGVEGVRKGKGELYDFLRQDKHTAFVNWDYGYLQTMSRGIENIIKYGSTEGEVIGSLIANEPFLKVGVQGKTGVLEIETQLVGDYNLPNVLSAVAVGRHFNITEANIKKAIEDYTPSNSRSQLLIKDSNTIILDAYNANPTSMKAAIENFAQLQAEKKIVLIGAMAELGDESIHEHEEIIKLLGKYNWEQVVLVGGTFGQIQHPFLYFSSSLEAKEWLDKQQFTNSHLLIKGSRSMQMEKLINI